MADDSKLNESTRPPHGTRLARPSPSHWISLATMGRWLEVQRLNNGNNNEPVLKTPNGLREQVITRSQAQNFFRCGAGPFTGFVALEDTSRPLGHGKPEVHINWLGKFVATDCIDHQTLLGAFSAVGSASFDGQKAAQWVPELSNRNSLAFVRLWVGALGQRLAVTSRKRQTVADNKKERSSHKGKSGA